MFAALRLAAGDGDDADGAADDGTGDDGEGAAGAAVLEDGALLSRWQQYLLTENLARGWNTSEYGATRFGEVRRGGGGD